MTNGRAARGRVSGLLAGVRARVVSGGDLRLGQGVWYEAPEEK